MASAGTTSTGTVPFSETSALSHDPRRPQHSPVPSNTIAGRIFRVDEFGVIVALVALVLVVGAFHPTFLHWAQLVDVVEQAAFVGILACGMTYLLAMRELDLSVGSVYALSIVGAATLIQGGMNPWLGAVAGVVLGCLLGTVNGIVCEAIKIPSIITTLGTLSLYRGLALAVSDGKNVAESPEHFMKGAVAIRLLAEAATEDKPLPEGWVDSGALLVTKDNVAEIIARSESDKAKDAWFGPRLDEFFGDLDSHVRPLEEAS